MKRKFLKLLLWLLLLVTGIFMYLVFVPRTYRVPKLQHRAATLFWDLPTGSRIGYIYIPGKGIRKASPIIFLEGGPGGHITEEDIQLRATLADLGYDIYMYDQVGSGQSGRLKNITGYTADRHKKDLEEIVKKTGAAKVILIGQSWGAVLAVLYAADNPGTIDKMILTCPGPIYPLRHELMAERAPDSLHIRPPLHTNAEANARANNIRTKAMAFFATRFGINLATDKEADDFATYLDHELNKSTVYDSTKLEKMEAGSGYYAGIMTVNSLRTIRDPRPGLKDSHIPVLIMKAQYDNQPWGFTQEYCALFSNHQLVVLPGVGHAIAVEDPALYLQTIAKFLTVNPLQ